MKPLAVSAFLCAMMALTSAADELGAPLKASCCSSSWTDHKDWCLYYVAKPMTWAQAQKNCQAMNGNLASVHSLDDYKLLQNAIFEASQARERTWIGGSDSQQDSYWFWIDGSRFKYTNWCPGQPNNKSNEGCIEMNFSGKKCMNDVNCLEKLPSICIRRKC